VGQEQSPISLLTASHVINVVCLLYDGASKLNNTTLSYRLTDLASKWPIASVLQAGQSGAKALQEFCVNDLEQPAFDK